jgi:hypothetical protein
MHGAIKPGDRGNHHDKAWEMADDAVRKMRRGKK